MTRISNMNRFGCTVLCLGVVLLGSCAAEQEPTDDLFDRTEVMEIELTLDEEDWDFIREQTRDIFDLLEGEDCMDEPFGSPFTYVSADVTIDGELFENIGLRKKGFIGSLDDEKPSLKIKFDKYVDGVELQGYERLTLNNCLQDPSLIRQCLGYDVFAAAGIPAPKCNFAHVTVNGQDLGIFANVESMKKQFLRGHFSDPDGDLYEGTLSDFREGWTGTFEKKTNKDEPESGKIEQVTTVLEGSDGNMVDGLDPLLDVDGFINFWATEVLIGHWDGYAGNTNNFFIYDDPTSGQFQFMPWGIDGIMNSEGGLEDEEDDESGLHSVYARGHMARRFYLYDTTQTSYVDRLQELLDTVWNEEDLLASIDSMEILLLPYIDGEVSDNIQIVRDFVSDQRDVITDELSPNPPQWTEPPAEPFCFNFDPIGSIDVHFDTTFGTLDVEDPFSAGTGTMLAEVNGVNFDPTTVGAIAGFDEYDPEMTIILTAGIMPDESFIVAYLVIPAYYLYDGVSIDTEYLMWDLAVYLVQIDPDTGEEEYLGMLGGGNISFASASTQDGAPIIGDISGNLVEGFL